ncbi:winged helix-turn-helix transcriptional regulator [Solimonas terrae]|uniref:Helix-turn-helix transcriptional regulator n=1 Tax=Solimonas terrae TaxID=1396819 RepID=A0A6M2BNM0_9GAMM|nr:helix-turn-helix domain-containing protein [Solimonas terrae]NGY03659.1 helix-turn-helix transcriptional regulator [Solimonas terrae]
MKARVPARDEAPQVRDVLDAASCSVAAAVAAIGDRWSLLLLREAFNGVRRYDDFLRHTGCSTAVLAVRLRKLVDAGIFRKQMYSAPGERPRAEYRLTAKGVDLLPVIVGLLQWGDLHVAGPGGGPLLLKDRRNGERIRVSLVNESGDLVDARDSQPIRNPAFRRGRLR